MKVTKEFSPVIIKLESRREVEDFVDLLKGNTLRFRELAPPLPERIKEFSKELLSLFNDH